MLRMGVREGVLGRVLVSGLSVVLLLIYCAVGYQKTMLKKRGKTLC